MQTETVEQQMSDSDMVFTQVSIAFQNYNEAQAAVALLYIPDRTISRSGISHALGRLEKFYRANPVPNSER